VIQYAARDEEDEILVDFFNNINHISRQIAAEASAEEVPFYPSVNSSLYFLANNADIVQDEGFKLVRISKPKKVVALEGTPHGTVSFAIQE
jgi:hypothetical protein